MLLLRAHAILSVNAPMISDAAIVIQGKRIMAVGRYRDISRQFEVVKSVDLGNSVILPGLINAHAHLDLSHLRNKVPFCDNFINWIDKVRNSREADEKKLSCIIADGCKESLNSGVTTVADISCGNLSWPTLTKYPIRKVCYAEVFGLSKDVTQQERFIRDAVAHISTDELMHFGISPHAPYSAGVALYELAARIAKEHSLSLTTHLAETVAENDFTQSGAGPFYDYLQRINKCPADYEVAKNSPVNYFLSLDLAGESFLLAHVNYLGDDELGRLSQTGHSVVYCPRSHAFFGHQPHKFSKMTGAKINVCLGTDSLASNTSLSILDEMRFLHRRYPDFPPETIIRAATLNGALALNLADQIGSLQAGKLADLIVLPLSGRSVDPVYDILQSTSQPVMTVINGNIIQGEY